MGKLVTMTDIHREINGIAADYAWIKELYDVIADIMQDENSQVCMFSKGRGFLGQLDYNTIRLKIQEEGFDMVAVDGPLIFELITIWSLIEEKEIPDGFFKVSTDFPILYLTVTGDTPDGHAANSTGGSV